MTVAMTLRVQMTDKAYLQMCQNKTLIEICTDLKIQLGKGKEKMTKKEQFVDAIVKSGWSQPSNGDDDDCDPDLDDEVIDFG
jgi:hypothetical protein